MRHIPARLRKLVIERSGERCEYCHLAQVGQEAIFHIDHVAPLATAAQPAAKIWRWLVFLARCAKARGDLPLIRKRNNQSVYSTRELTFGRSILNGAACVLSG